MKNTFHSAKYLSIILLVGLSYPNIHDWIFVRIYSLYTQCILYQVEWSSSNALNSKITSMFCKNLNLFFPHPRTSLYYTLNWRMSPWWLLLCYFMGSAIVHDEKYRNKMSVKEVSRREGDKRRQREAGQGEQRGKEKRRDILVKI